MSILVITFIILIVFLFLIFIITPSKQRHLDEIKLLEQEKQYYRQDIATLKQAHESLKIDRKTNLTRTTNEALNQYEQSNIRIPADILEELSHQHFDTLKETIDFIENQRSHWKLENTKKLHRR